MLIDLRSDTITRPSPGMLDAMGKAIVGDDVFGDDPTVINLQDKIASIFGMEAALFCPSGTMTNQIAVKVHTQPGDEVICDITAHVYNYEGGGLAFNAACSVRLIQGDRGRFTGRDVLENINPDNEHFPVTKLVVIENTSNKGGGSIWDDNDIAEIGKTCKETGLKLHLDGARLFNAMVETAVEAKFYGKTFDSISICLSKGLGCPVGSLLLGDETFIKKAKRIRKVFGGGMRQAGYLAAAGTYALENNINRLKEDHKKAKQIAAMLKKQSYVEEILPVETNIVVFRLTADIIDQAFLEFLGDNGILATGFGPQTIRMVTHMDFREEMLKKLETTLATATNHFK